VATFSRESEAMEALVQLAEHSALLRREPAQEVAAATLPRIPSGTGRFLNEAESLALLAAAGLPVIPHRLCGTEDDVRAAFESLGGPVALKACSRDAPHKSELGLVALGVASAEAAAAEFRRQRGTLVSIGASVEGILVAKMAARGRELALGARVDPQFGAVVLVGAGGIYLEALKDFALLLPPFGADEVLAALARLHMAPLLAGVRGEPPRDLDAVAAMAVRLGEAMLGWRGELASIDVNPVIVFEKGRGAVAVDALLERHAGG